MYIEQSKARRADPTRTETAKARSMRLDRDRREKSARLFLAIMFEG
jgi:hypothetical protein